MAAPAPAVPPSLSRPLLFVGERRSPTARRMGVRWQDGRLAAKPLHEALLCLGIDPAAQGFLNLFAENRTDWKPTRAALCAIARARRAEGRIVVALGKPVARALAAASIPHLALVHPAARGRIRLAARYRAHVAETLGPVSLPLAEKVPVTAGVR